MFTPTMRPFEVVEVVDEAGIRLAWHDSVPEWVNVIFPRSYQADYPYRGRYRATVSYAQWVRDDARTLVVTYSMMAQAPAKVGRRRRLWKDRFRHVTGVGDAMPWVYASPRHGAHLVAEGLAVLFSSVPEIARRFDHVEVHRVLNLDQRQVFTGGYPGIADKVKAFEEARHAEQVKVRWRE